jgi:tetratricopeptide (TPR) repeat protein
LTEPGPPAYPASGVPGALPSSIVAIDRDKTLQAAAKLVDKKKYDKAIAEYQKVVQADPSDARTLLRIGDLQSRINDFAGAVATYDQVGRFYSGQGFHLKAIAVYKQIRELIKKHAPELAPRYAHVLPKLAEIYAELGLTSDALLAYDELAASLQASGRDKDAVQALQKTVQLDPQNPLPYLRLAEACCRIQDLDSAISAFWTAAQILLSLGRPDDALKVLERILTFRPAPEYARASAALYLRHNTNEAGMAALARLQVAFQANPKDLETLSLLAQAFQIIGQPEKAFAVHLEMTRLARDQHKPELFREMLAHLKTIAPGHEQVLLLERLGPGGSSAAPGPESTSARSGQPGVRPPLTRPPGTRPQLSSAPAPSIEVDLADEAVLDEDEAAAFAEEALADEALAEEILADEEGYEEVEFVEEAADQVLPSARADGPSPKTERSSATAPAESLQPGSVNRKAIVNAEAFQRLGLIDKAVEALHLALESDPNSVPVREKLREILVEAGEREAAIEETLNIAIIHIHLENADLAEPLIAEVLDIEPEHPEALNLLVHVQALRGETGSVRPSTARPGSTGRRSVFDMEGMKGPPLEMPKAGPLPKFDSTPPAPPRERPSPEAIEEVLEEAEFFASQGLYEDAEAILADTLAAAPGHVLLTERLAEVRQALLAHGQSPRSALPPSHLAEDQAFDIAATLDALDDFDPVMPKATSPTEQVDVDQVFAKFKEGIKATIDDSDAATHYDLGVAYKEMGLLDDARSEFELASRDAQRAVMCHYMIGSIFRDQGDLGKARDAFLKALRSESRSPDQTKALEYDLGSVYEAQGDRESAIVMFKSIYRKDPEYRDVVKRMNGLGAKPSLNPSDEDRELDQALENLFG